jgi:uncharacterized membrane protein YdjX (TVP38/TMEM64 family)
VSAAIGVQPRPAGAPSPVRKFIGIALFALSFALAAAIVVNKPAVDGILAAAGPGALPLAIVIFALVASAPLSVTDALAVSNGVLFGPWVGAVVNAAGLVLAAILGYIIARRTSRLLDIDAQIARLPAWLKRFRVGSPLFLILVRIIPGIGGTLATQTAAALKVGLPRQIVTMCIVTVPVCTALAFGGSAISSYVSAKIIGPAEHYATRHHLGFPHKAQLPK